MKYKKEDRVIYINYRNHRNLYGEVGIVRDVTENYIIVSFPRNNYYKAFPSNIIQYSKTRMLEIELNKSTKEY